MSNVTYAFNSTAEFYGVFFKNISYALGGGVFAGLFFWALATLIVHKIAGLKGSVPVGLGLAVMLSNIELLPKWVSPLTIMLTSLGFAIYVYEKSMARRV